MRKLVLLFVFLLTIPAFALEPGEALSNPADEARARSLMAELRCLVCQSESIEASPSSFAREVRALVREQIATGRSDAEIKTFLTVRYGDAILFRPRWGRATWILWLGPFVVLGLGGLMVVIVLRGAGGGAGKGTPSGAHNTEGNAGDLSREEQARLAELLNQDNEPSA